MFKQIQRKLTVQYLAFFLLFVFLLMIVLYFAIIAIVQQQQVQELKLFHQKEHYHLMGDNIRKDREIEYDANRIYFYYIFTNRHKLVHGDESIHGLSKDIDQLMVHAKDGDPQSIEWKGEHLLLLKYHQPLNSNGNYMIIGQSVTKEFHLLERMMYAIIILTLIGIIIIAFLSHYLAGKAMVPIKQSFDRQRKFVSDASHELRTPLTVFYSSLEVLESDDENRFSTFGQEVITDLKDEAQHMETLLEGLLFLARFDQNKLPIKKDSIVLSDIVKNMTKSFERTLPESIKLKTKIDGNIHFIGDETKIREMLYILLDNAAKFTEQGFINVSLSSFNNKIELIVEDSGIGISEQDTQHIFERFYQATKNQQKEGTGLGLAIAHAIVLQHQGHISVESKLGQGTKFIVSLPIQNKKD
ncbi:sensor histidine kinase [Rummeliibacillus pycnus]|uniref:sensor histidine kinase n=1 Tax=Rummeliibacillus pycnus TaxID=101070 RepID=UPI0037CC4BE6